MKTTNRKELYKKVWETPIARLSKDTHVEPGRHRQCRCKAHDRCLLRTTVLSIRRRRGVSGKRICPLTFNRWILLKIVRLATCQPGKRHIFKLLLWLGPGFGRHYLFNRVCALTELKSGGCIFKVGNQCRFRDFSLRKNLAKVGG